MKKRYVAFGCTGLGLVGGLGGVALLLVVGLVLLLVVVPGIVKGKVERLVADQIDQNVDAVVAFGAVDVSMISSFPRIRVRFRDVSIVGHDPFDGVTLAEIPELTVKVGLMSALSGQTLSIQAVELTDPRFEVVVLPDGRTNTDIYKGGSGDTVSSGPSMIAGYHLELDDVSVTNLDAKYEDRKGKLRAVVSDLDFAVRANLSDAVSRVDARGTIGGLTVKKGKTSWLKDTKWKVDALLDYDLQTGGITFRENRTTVNAFPVELTGSAVPKGDAWNVDLAFAAKDASFASILSLVPNAFRGTMEGVDTAGTLTFEGTSRGRYGGEIWPGFDVTVAVRDARFKYPDLPVAIQDIDVDLKAHHEEGPGDTTKIDVSRFAFAVAGSEPFVASAKISHPLTDPVVDAVARGHLDLAAIGGALPLPEGTDPPTGRVDVDVAFSGAQSDFLKPNVDRIHASGTVRGRNVTYRSEDLPVAVIVDTVQVSLAADSAKLEAFTAHYASKSEGDSDISATGRLDNLVGYALGGEVLTGTVALTSNKLDLRPFQGAGASGTSPPAKDTKGKKGKSPKPEPAPTDGEALLVAVPSDLALTIDADLQRVLTKQIDVDKVKGTMTVRDGAVRMNELKVSMLGGSALVSGAYVAPTAESADIDMTLSAVKFDLGRTLSAVTTLKRIAPILEGAAGSFDLGITAKTRVGRDGTPDLSLLASSGLIRPSAMEIRPKSLAKAAKQLGQDSYSTIDLGGTELAYAMADGKAKLEPFVVKMGQAKSTVKGTVGIVDETVDVTFKLKVPTRGLDGTVLAGMKDTFGAEADVNVRVKGSWNDPQITVGLEGVDAGELIGDLVDSLVGGEADAGLEAALASARKAADELIAAADAQANKLVSAAKGNPIAEATAAEAAKALRTEAKKAADKLVADAEKGAGSVSGGGASGGKTGKAGKAGKARMQQAP